MFDDFDTTVCVEELGNFDELLNIDNMKRSIIECYGFEHSKTIKFFKVCENANYKEIEKLYDRIMFV